MHPRLRHLGLLIRMLPGLVFHSSWRGELASMRQRCRRLPEDLKGPLPQALAGFAPECPGTRPSDRLARRVRRLADTAVILERRSPLGLCLRRSLIRFHALRTAGLPVVVCFGARHVTDRDGSLAGHAWLTLDGVPYQEPSSSFEGWTVMYTYPPADEQESG